MTTTELVTAALAEREEVIARGLKTFIEVGRALAEIKEQKLYRQVFSTFEEYCDNRWQLARTRAYELIYAAETAKAMSEISNKHIPKNEGQAKQLRGLTAQVAVKVMQEAEQATGGKITAAAIRDAREKIENPPADIPAEDIMVECRWCGGLSALSTVYESNEGGYECETCVSGESAEEPEQAAPPPDDRRQPLAPAFLRKSVEVTKAAEALRRKVDDDRFSYNSAAMSRDNLPELIRAKQDLEYVIAALQANWQGSEYL